MTQTQEKPTPKVTPIDQKIEAPSAPGEWSLAKIEAALSRPLPKSYLRTRRQGGKEIVFIEWHTANKILSKYAPGWTWEVKDVKVVGVSVVTIGSLSIPTADGVIHRDATGHEELDGTGYGNCSANSEANALKRAAAKFGLGLYLYHK